MDLKEEKLIEHFAVCSHNGTHKDIKVQIIEHHDRSDQEARKDY